MQTTMAQARAEGVWLGISQHAARAVGADAGRAASHGGEEGVQCVLGSYFFTITGLSIFKETLGDFSRRVSRAEFPKE